jgi:hypothetical protein
MYLTHIDANGNDSPAILIDNATAANRAVNLPEFVNIGEDAIEEIKVNVADDATRRANARDTGITKSADSSFGRDPKR